MIRDYSCLHMSITREMGDPTKRAPGDWVCDDCDAHLRFASGEPKDPDLLAVVAAGKVALDALEQLSDGMCHSKYGPGCDNDCKNFAYGAWEALRSALAKLGE